MPSHSSDDATHNVSTSIAANSSKITSPALISELEQGTRLLCLHQINVPSWPKFAEH